MKPVKSMPGLHSSKQRTLTKQPQLIVPNYKVQVLQAPSSFLQAFSLTSDPVLHMPATVFQTHTAFFLAWLLFPVCCSSKLFSLSALTDILKKASPWFKVLLKCQHSRRASPRVWFPAFCSQTSTAFGQMCSRDPFFCFYRCCLPALKHHILEEHLMSVYLFILTLKYYLLH